MKKILLLIIICLTIYSNLVVTAFDDIEDTSTIEAVITLAEFSIVKGYQDNTFKPHNNITRAEFSKIITETILCSNNRIEETQKFEDVDESLWANDYIYIAKGFGIINGTTATTFEPEANITYEQAIKMIVVALGYDIEAKEKGGYPNGYIAVANDLGILSDVKFNSADMTTRGNIAIIIRKTLDVPFYFLFNDGEAIQREKSDLTLFELHTQSLIPISEDKDTDEVEIESDSKTETDSELFPDDGEILNATDDSNTVG